MDRCITRLHVALIAAALLIGLGVRAHYYTGTIASDDLSHSYAAVHFFDGPIETFSGVRVSGAYSVNGRRIGLNLPLWIATEIGGPSELTFSTVPLLFSLAGILIAFAVVRSLAGTAAGVAAAWVWALLPADAYEASVWMQDNVFATLMLAFIGLWMASERAARPRAWAIAAGATVGYMEYLKESAFFLAVPIAIVVVVRVWRERRVDARPLWMTVGFVAVQLLAAVYFWRAVDDPIYFWRASFERYSELATSYQAPFTFPDNWLRLWRYARHQWVFGFAIVIAPALLVAALAWRQLPGLVRVGLGATFAVQLWLLSEAVKLGVWTQRYTLQITAPLVVLMVVGVVAAIDRIPPRFRERLPERVRTWLLPVALGVVVLATGAALDRKHQQHGRFRAQVVRDAFAYLDRTVGATEPIYVDVRKGDPYYTQRALTVLAGFQPWKGGFRPLAQAYAATDGWVILTHLENTRSSTQAKAQFKGIPDNWLEVYRSENQRGRYWARVFRVLPAPVPTGLRVVRRTAPGEDPDVSALAFTAVRFDDRGDGGASWRSERWTRAAAVTAEPGADRITVTVTAQGDDSTGGIRIPVDGLGALRFTITTDHPEHIAALQVYGFGERAEKRSQRWRGKLTGPPGQPVRTAVTLVPGERGAWMELATSDLPASAIREVHVFVRVKPGTTASFVLETVETAPAKGDR